MKIKFDKLFEIEFEHEYFSTGQLEGIVIQPTEQTIQILNNYGLLFRKTSKGFVVLYEIDTANSAGPPLKPIDSPEKFSFEVFINYPGFTNITGIPLGHKLPHIFYFDNLEEHITDGSLILSKQDRVGAEDVVELASRYYEINKETTGILPSLEALDRAGTTLFSKKIYAPDNQLNYQLDLGKLSTGWLEVKIEGTREKILYYDPVLPGKSIFAVLNIHVSDKVPTSYRFVAPDGSVSSKSYTLGFSKRKSTWKYYIILQNSSAGPLYSISYGTRILPDEAAYPATINFNQKETASLTPSEKSILDEYGSDRAFVFESDGSLPFYEHPKKNIRLSKTDPANPGNPPVEVIASLPNASSGILKTNTANTEAISEIFIYV